MEVNVSKNGTAVAVKVSGRIDTATSAEFQQDLAPVMAEENAEVVVDCSDIDYISSSGLRVFLLLKKSVDSHKGSLTLESMKPQVKEVFDITGFSSIINII